MVNAPNKALEYIVRDSYGSMQSWLSSLRSLAVRGVRIRIVPEMYHAQSLKVDSTGSCIEGEDVIGVDESRFAKPERQSAHASGEPLDWQSRTTAFRRVPTAAACLR